MKKLLLIIFVFPSIIIAQFKIDTLKSEGSFSKIYDIKLSKEQLHQNTVEWIALNFKNPDEIIKLDTEDKIIGKGYFDVEIISGGYKFIQKVYTVIEVSFKENKYKLDFSDFVVHSDIQGSEIKTPYNQFLSCLNKESYINYLKKLMIDNPTGGLVSDKRVKKIYSKILNNPKLIDENIAKSVVYEKQYTSQIRNNVEGFAVELLNYIKGNSSDDW